MGGKIDWYYHRNGCKTCARTDGLIERAKLTIQRQINARKERLGPDDAVRLARSVAHVWVTRGKKVVHLDMKKDQPSDREIVKLLIGPSGNLRAPTIRRGKKLFVGYDEAGFEGQLV